MFGYIKTKKEELLVKDWSLYRAVYCGLCHEIKKNVSFPLSFGLSYDFVFLAIVRDILTGSEASVRQGRCPYNPFKKRAFAHSDGIVFASRVALLLAEKNLDDKRRDRDLGILSPLLSIAQQYLKRREKKLFCDEVYSELEKSVTQALYRYSELEKEKANLDTLATGFGEVLSLVVGTGIEGDKKRIAEILGRSVGAWLYLADAVDDLENDYKKNKFNPLLDAYTTPENVKSHFEEIDVSFGGWAKDAYLALSLLNHKTFLRIADNILLLGLPEEAYRLMNKGRKK